MERSTRFHEEKLKRWAITGGGKIVIGAKTLLSSTLKKRSTEDDNVFAPITILPPPGIVRKAAKTPRRSDRREQKPSSVRSEMVGPEMVGPEMVGIII